MQAYKDIDNTRYIISRVFSDNKTKTKLIEERIINDKKDREALTQGSGVVYNNLSGSIQSKEVL